MQDAIGLFVRACVATTFVLSAGWKLRHSPEFAAVLRSLRITGAPARALGGAVPAAEVAVAVALVIPGSSGQFAGAAAAVLTLALGATVLRRDLSAGCGCWSGVHPQRGPLLARNAVLLALALAAAVLPPSPASAELLLVVPIAMIFGLLLIELPTIVHYVANAQGAPS